MNNWNWKDRALRAENHLRAAKADIRGLRIENERLRAEQGRIADREQDVQRILASVIRQSV